MIENVDYELIPGDNDHWNIRILTGDYVESVFNYGAIKVTESGEELSYDVTLVESPDPDLSVEDEEFQQYTGNILISIIESSIANEEQRRTANP